MDLSAWVNVSFRNFWPTVGFICFSLQGRIELSSDCCRSRAFMLSRLRHEALPSDCCIAFGANTGNGDRRIASSVRELGTSQKPQGKRSLPRNQRRGGDNPPFFSRAVATALIRYSFVTPAM